MLQVVCIFCLWFNFTLINPLKRREIFVLCVLLNKLCVFFLYLYIFNACISLMKELAIFNSLWLGFFMSVLHAFCCYLNIILVHIYWLLLQQSALKFPAVYCHAFCGNQLFEFLLQFNWLVAPWWGIWVWGILEQTNNSFIYKFNSKWHSQTIPFLEWR